MLSLICVPHIRSRHPPYPAAVLTTLSPGLSSQLLSHTAVSLVHLSCPPLFCFISTLLTSLTSSYVSLLLFSLQLSGICLSLPVHFPCCFIFLLLTFTFCLYFSFFLYQPPSLSSHPSMSSFPRVYPWEEMSGFCMKCGTSISAKPE